MQGNSSTAEHSKLYTNSRSNKTNYKATKEIKNEFVRYEDRDENHVKTFSAIVKMVSSESVFKTSFEFDRVSKTSFQQMDRLFFRVFHLLI